MIIVQVYAGLGNQLFMYAAGRWLAWHHKTELKLDISQYETYKDRKYELSAFNIIENIASADEIEKVKKLSYCDGKRVGHNSKHPALQEEFFSFPSDVYLTGFWQCERYFSEISDIICREFTIKAPLSTQAGRWKNKILSSKNSVALTVRRGDYLVFEHARKNYGVCPVGYFKRCLDKLRREVGKLNIFISTDDFAWAKENLNDIGTCYYMDDVEGVAERLYLISLCNHHILPNSTFSWWGAWLSRNPEKKIFTPYPWFDRPKSDRNVREIIPSNWIRVNKYDEDMDSRTHDISRYVFPWHLVKKSERIVIYGAGIVGESFLHQTKLLDYVKIVMIVDKFKQGEVLSGMVVQSLNKLESVAFDRIIIAVESKETADEIQNELIGMGINKASIRWDGESYSFANYHRKVYFPMLASLG